MTDTQFPEFTAEARKRWDTIPSWAQQKILNAVWCGTCLKGVSMDVTKGRMEEQILILEGTCIPCGKKVVKLVEPDE
jgi:hypothetical protein